MKTAVIAVSLLLMLGELVNAVEPPTESKGEGVVKFMMSQVSAYDATIGKEHRANKLHPTPVLRWTNPVSGVDHGILVVWHEKNRPVVLAQVFKIPEPVFWLHECQSITTEPIRFELEGQPVWAPARGTLEFKELAMDKAPADNAALRLTQARSIARRFEATEDFRNTPEDDATKFVLRLNAQPVYQYESESFDVTNGYVFAFVNGTDPEVLLVVESFQSDSRQGWRYLLSPMTCWSVAAKLDGAEVWSVPEQYGKTNENDPYFAWVVNETLLQQDPTD